MKKLNKLKNKFLQKNIVKLKIINNNQKFIKFNNNGINFKKKIK